MVLRFLFGLERAADGSPVLTEYHMVDIRDSGFGPDMRAIQQKCGIQ